METQHTGGHAEGGDQHVGGTRRSFGDAVRGMAAAKASEQKHRATESLGQVAQALRRATDVLREDGRSGLANYVQRASDRIEQFSHRIDEQDLQQMIEQVQQFARRQPALFIGAAFGLGLLGGRLLKSSSHGDRHTASGPGFHGGSRVQQPGLGSGQPLRPTSELHGGGPLT
ncbi:MAG TPA: hypothetical protein VF198_18085 [Vicinamibacterales bacterium]